MAPQSPGEGRVVAIRGAVIDVGFEAGGLPPINDALVVEGHDIGKVTVEVQAHLDEMTVRTIALRATNGLRRGATVARVGGPVEVPVGDAVLGRLLNGYGRHR